MTQWSNVKLRKQREMCLLVCVVLFQQAAGPVWLSGTNIGRVGGLISTGAAHTQVYVHSIKQ